MLVALFSATLLQVQPPPAPQQYRLEILPRDPVVIAQDTLRLRPRLLDASGQPVTAEFRFLASSGARFEGRVDSTGLVRSGSTGTIPVTVIAQVAGQPAVSQRVEVRMVAGPAASTTLKQPVGRLVVGQRRHIASTVMSAAGDTRDDQVAWTSSNPAVARVTSEGLLTAIAPGGATITGRA